MLNNCLAKNKQKTKVGGSQKSFSQHLEVFPRVPTLCYCSLPFTPPTRFSNHLHLPLLSVAAFLPFQIGKIREKGKSAEGRGREERAQSNRFVQSKDGEEGGLRKASEADQCASLTRPSCGPAAPLAVIRDAPSHHNYSFWPRLSDPRGQRR